MSEGTVYVMVNSSIPGLVKVGRTTRSAADRAAELSSSTGVAMPFVLAFEQPFEDCVAAERKIHAELERQGLRVMANREFFRVPAADVIRLILAHATPLPHGLHSPAGVSPSRQQTIARLLDAADRSLHGTGDALQDTGEAARLYAAAAQAGSALAMEKLGCLYLLHSRGNQADRRRAMRLLKQGALAGNDFCLAELGTLFAQAGHASNFAKVWDQFFQRRSTAHSDEESEAGRLGRACRAYVGGCIDLGLEPCHLAALVPEAEAMTAALLAAMADPGLSAAARFRLARILRWCFQTLGPLAEGAAAAGHAAAVDAAAAAIHPGAEQGSATARSAVPMTRKAA